MSDDDRELLERIRGGDTESFGTLYDRTRSWLLSFVIVPRVGAAEAEDVLAATFRVGFAALLTAEQKTRLQDLLALQSSLQAADALRRLGL